MVFDRAGGLFRLLVTELYNILWYLIRRNLRSFILLKFSTRGVDKCRSSRWSFEWHFKISCKKKSYLEYQLHTNTKKNGD